MEKDKLENIYELIKLNEFFNELNKLNYWDLNLDNFFDGYDNEELILKEVSEGIDIREYLMELDIWEDKEVKELYKKYY